MLSHLALIQQRCVDPCPGRLRSLLHDSSRPIDAYSSLHRFSSRSNERYDQRVAYSDLQCTLKEAPFLGTLLLPDIWASPASPSVISRGASPNGKPLRLMANPFT